MIKKMLNFLVVCFFLLNLSGCFMLLAGAAGGAGTAYWLSGKLSQQVDSTFEEALKASQEGLENLRLEVTKMTRESNHAQILSKYTDGKTIWVDVDRLASNSARIEIRVGGVSPDKAAAEKILTSIKQHL